MDGKFSSTTCVAFVEGVDRVDPGRLRRALARAHDPGPLPHIAAALDARLDDLRLQPERILDLGGRTGTLAGLLRGRWPQATLVRVGLEPVAVRRTSWPSGVGRALFPALAADLAHLPLATGSFDLVVSNMVLHWCADLLGVFREVRRVLRPGGFFLFTLSGRATLRELRHALAELDRARHGRTWPRVLTTPDMLQIGDQLAASGLATPVMDREHHALALPSVAALVSQLRALGVGNHHQERPPGLVGKGFVPALEAVYRRLYPRSEGDIQATLEICFGHACRFEDDEQRPPVRCAWAPM
ncbi:MAG: methyltransferase domain-containing protein [Magnetococcales bacterium]|nr:methyltransferase domain-containing protein [Magnetococcales bacterium]